MCSWLVGEAADLFPKTIQVPFVQQIVVLLKSSSSWDSQHTLTKVISSDGDFNAIY
jgi:hypothetical protein